MSLLHNPQGAAGCCLTECGIAAILAMPGLEAASIASPIRLSVATDSGSNNFTFSSSRRYTSAACKLGTLHLALAVEPLTPPNPRLLLYAALQQQQGNDASSSSSSSSLLQRRLRGHGAIKYRCGCSSSYAMPCCCCATAASIGTWSMCFLKYAVCVLSSKRPRFLSVAVQPPKPRHFRKRATWSKVHPIHPPAPTKP
jgi:hypothetical protein